jgi:hypothetical protein
MVEPPQVRGGTTLHACARRRSRPTSPPALGSNLRKYREDLGISLIAEALTLYKEGWSLARIAKRFGEESSFITGQTVLVDGGADPRT